MVVKSNKTQHCYILHFPRRGDSRRKESSRQGAGKVITLAPREDVKLREAENAWKPGAKKTEAAAGEEDEVEVLCKKIRSILNKLCPQKVRSNCSLPITSAKLHVFNNNSLADNNSSVE